MSLFWLDRKRRRLARQIDAGPLATLLSSPLPAKRNSFRDTEFVCLDIETSGLDASTAELLSAGWVIVRNGCVSLASCSYHVVRSTSGVGDSATVHGLTDTQVGIGEDPGVVLDGILDALTGRVLVVHHAGLDKAMLDRLCRERYGCELPVPVVDTLALELKRRRRQHHVADNASLRLGELRDVYGLPRYQAHDALVDAISTAELLMAMVASQDGVDRTELKDLLTG